MLYLSKTSVEPMKLFLLFLSSFFTVAVAAQQGNVSSLPPGKYETVVRNSQMKWERGDIILLDDNKYKISTSSEIGEYRFSVAAQRIFFTSGPLRNIFARASSSNNKPSIILPAAENAQAGVQSEIVCYLRQ